MPQSAYHYAKYLAVAVFVYTWGKGQDQEINELL